MAEKKHLFGTTEKSDFILNMTEQGTKKLCGLYCIIVMAVLTIAAIPYYFTKDVVDYIEVEGGIEFVHYLNEKTIYWVSTLMIGAGAIGYCIFIIGKMKGQISLKDNKALIWLGAIIFMSILSSLLSDYVVYALTGYLDRAEGLISILGYIGFFAAAMTVTGDNWRKNICDALVGIGAFNSVIGILQSIPAVGEKMPNYFAYLFKDYGTLAAEGEKVIGGSAVYTMDYAASGFACTPFALGAILTVTFAVAFAGAVFDDSKLRKILYSLGGIIMTVCAALTQVVPSVIGIASAAVMVLVVAVAAKVKFEDKSKGTKAVASAAAGVAAVAAAFGIMAAAGQLEFKDEQVINTDITDRLVISTLAKEDKDTWIYPYLWDDGMYVFENNIIFGTGPDNWGTMSSLGASIDRSYNEYIDIAMQRGIITLALYVVFLIITLKKAFCAVGEFFAQNKNWAAAAMLCGFTAYIIQAFFNISSISSSPFFWLAAGLIWSYGAKGTKKSKA